MSEQKMRIRHSLYTYSKVIDRSIIKFWSKSYCSKRKIRSTVQTEYPVHTLKYIGFYKGLCTLSYLFGRLKYESYLSGYFTFLFG